MRWLGCLLALSGAIHARQAPALIHVTAKIVDWRGRPAAGSIVSLSLVRHLGRETALISYRNFKVTSEDGLVDLEAPAGTWSLDVRRAGMRRGHAVLERNTCLICKPPEYQMTPPSDPGHPLILKLRMAEWNESTGTSVWCLDMTTPAQGQTFNMDEVRAIPMR